MIEILKYENNLIDEWDSFIERSNNGTIFHKQKFLSYHITRSFQDHSLLFKKRGRIIAVFPAAKQQKKSKKILFSHPGASFGGIVYRNLTYEDCQKILELIEKEALENNFDDIFIIQPPTVFCKYQNDEIVDYCLRRRNYNSNENYLTSVLLVEQNVNNQIRKICKNKNRSEGYYNKLIEKNSLSFKWVSRFDDFYPILIKNKNKHNALPTHSLEELEKLRLLFPNDVLQLMLYKNDAIGGMTIFRANQKCIIIFYSMFDYKYNNLQPITLLMQYLIRWSNKNNIKIIDYGVSHQPSRTKSSSTAKLLELNKSLIRFKEEFGCFASIRNTYHQSE